MLSDLLRDLKALEVLRRRAPQVLNAEQTGLSTQTTLRAMQAFENSLTDEVVAQIDRNLAALPSASATVKIQPAAQSMLDKWAKPERPPSIDSVIC